VIHIALSTETQPQL